MILNTRISKIPTTFEITVNNTNSKGGKKTVIETKKIQSPNPIPRGFLVRNDIKLNERKNITSVPKLYNILIDNGQFRNNAIPNHKSNNHKLTS